MIWHFPQSLKQKRTFDYLCCVFQINTLMKNMRIIQVSHYEYALFIPSPYCALTNVFFKSHVPFLLSTPFFFGHLFFCTTQIHSHTACSSSEQMTHEHMNMPFTWKICMQNGSGNGNQNLLQKIERTDSCKSVKIKLRQSKIKVKHTKKNWPE